MPMWWKRPKAEATKAREEVVSKKSGWWRPFARKRQLNLDRNSASEAIREISALTEKRDALIEETVNEKYKQHLRESSTRPANPQEPGKLLLPPGVQRERQFDEGNYTMVLNAARALALHDPSIAAFQKQVNQKIAELNQRISLPKTAELILKQRVRAIPTEIQELEAQKRKWESQIVTSEGAERKRAQGMLSTIDNNLAEKRRELKTTSKSVGSMLSLRTALQVVAGPGYSVSSLGFSGGDQYHDLTQFGSNPFPDIGLRKKNHRANQG